MFSDKFTLILYVGLLVIMLVAVLSFITNRIADNMMPKTIDTDPEEDNKNE